MSIGVVVVTYNRLEKLKKAINEFENQTLHPDYMIIVNNHSNDGTKEFLEQWKIIKSDFKKIVIETESNIGGSGGFYTGLEEAIKHDSEWIWVSDDDAFPKSDVIEKANNYIENNDMNGIAAICTSVINKGKIDYKHRRKLNKRIFTIKTTLSTQNDYEKEYFPINEFSYVGAIMKKEYLTKYGLTRKDFFIYYDDSEHSYRMSKYGKIICIPKLEVYHDTDESNDDYNWKTYYGIRNELLYFKTIGKRYFVMEYLKIKIKLLLKKFVGYKKYSYKIIEDALHDAKSDVSGKSKTYIPGLKVK